MLLKSILRCGVFAPALMMAGAGMAKAQTLPTTPADSTADTAGATGDVVVTGSRIRGNPLNQDAPVVTVDQSAIARTGLSSVADILQHLPSASGGLNSKVNSSGNFGNPPDGGGVGAGSAEIELRYLQAKRTLVLVDGLRFVNGTSASGIPATVDLNELPASMIDHIDVLQSGASSIYGSDAIAGVVNIVTKASQKGLQASAQFGSYRQGDGHTQEYNISYGLKNQGMTLVFGGSYVKQESVLARDRAISRYPSGTDDCHFSTSCSSATPLGRFLFTNPAIYSGSLTLKAPVSGTPRFDPLDPTGANSDFTSYTTAANGFNYGPYNYILTPSERWGLWTSFKQELSSNVNLRVKMVYNRRNSQNKAAFLPLFIGPGAGTGGPIDTVTVDATNPYNPFGTITPNDYVFFARRLVEAGQRTYNQHVDTMSVTATLDGSFDLGGHRWYWDVNAVVGKNDAHQLFTGNVNAAKVAQALGPVSQCTGDCVPLNIFGGVGSITPAMLKFIGFDERDSSSQSMEDYTANLSGSLLDLPAGPLGVAIGYEHRNQRGSFTPDPVIQAGLGSDIPALASQGGYHVDEVYAELKVPILADTPFFESLEADGSGRYSRYSTAGSNWTYTGSGLWKPVKDVLLRASYAHTVRAPSIGELFGSQSRFDQTLDVDPCSNIAGSPYQSSATVRTNCTAAGVPADGSYQEVVNQVGVVTGGSTALKPETSNTLLLGGVYSPSWARSGGFASALSLEVNYYAITVNDTISSIPATTLLDRCAQTGDALSCAAVKRASNGFITRIDGVLQNVGAYKTRGIDVAFNYRSPLTSVGTFGLSANGTFLLSLTKAVPSSTGLTVTEYLGTENDGGPDQAYPRFKGNATIDWSGDVFSASFTGRYISSVVELQGGNRLNSRFYGDIQMTFLPTFLDKRVALTLGVNNVFNQDPPGCVNCSLNHFDPTTYDVPGQFGYARLSYKM